MKKPLLFLIVLTIQLNLFSQSYFENTNQFTFNHFIIDGSTIEYPDGLYDAGFNSILQDSNDFLFEIHGVCGSITSATVVDNGDNTLTVVNRGGTTTGSECDPNVYDGDSQDMRIFDILTGYYYIYPDNPLTVYYNFSEDGYILTMWTDENEKLVFDIDQDCCGSINDEAFKNEFSIYPNPLKDKLNIKTNISNYNLEVYDVLGKQVLKKQDVISEIKLDISLLSKGIYLLKITNGKNSFTEKLVKK